jgi:hypothetical protein
MDNAVVVAAEDKVEEVTIKAATTDRHPRRRITSNLHAFIQCPEAQSDGRLRLRSRMCGIAERRKW